MELDSLSSVSFVPFREEKASCHSYPDFVNESSKDWRTGIARVPKLGNPESEDDPEESTRAVRLHAAQVQSVH